MKRKEQTYNLLELADKWQKGTISPEEKAYYESWYNAFDDTKVEVAQMPDEELIYGKLKKRIEKKPRTVKLWPRIAAAIAIVFCIGIGYAIYLGRTTEGFRLARNYKNDIAPGKNTATLTSSNGSTINLSEAKTGVAINATALTYNDGTKIDPSALGMTDGDSRSLEVITPKGGIYSIILQDGTKVWLNSDSKLEFLSNYRNRFQRIVKLSGEAYFEVAKDAKRPFVVESNGQRTTVLGTHFNISAYKGEPIRTTLLEGSVSVRHLEGSEATRDLLNSINKRSLGVLEMTGKGRDDGKGGNAVILKPNQQSNLTGSTIKVTEANIEETMAWKNGYFRFNDEKIETIMTRLARWYDIEVVYEGKMSTDGFTGTASRNKNISQILSLLENTKSIHFKIEGRRVTVIR